MLQIKQKLMILIYFGKTNAHKVNYFYFLLKIKENLGGSKDFVEINHVTYQKLDEVKVVTQPVKIIRTLDPFKPKLQRFE